MGRSTQIQNTLLVSEIFHSIQGEGTHSGLPYVFIRLTGCNLRCTYCDTSYAFHGGSKMSVEEILSQAKAYHCARVLLTGGEPLMQRPALALCKALFQCGFEVSIETHGEAPIYAFSPFARIIMDIKTPSSNMCRGGFRKNLPFLKATDEIKFVIGSKEDYFWAKALILSGELPATQAILLSAANTAANAPGKFPGVELRWLAEKILEDKLPVRLQTQLHKTIWGLDTRGV
ncbi:MAG: radical SAM protein [Bdellovibrionales bacterium]|nr:radical SAM protein [Bdellovibrionales bacterium]